MCMPTSATSTKLNHANKPLGDEVKMNVPTLHRVRQRLYDICKFRSGRPSERDESALSAGAAGLVVLVVREHRLCLDQLKKVPPRAMSSCSRTLPSRDHTGKQHRCRSMGFIHPTVDEEYNRQRR